MSAHETPRVCVPVAGAAKSSDKREPGAAVMPSPADIMGEAAHALSHDVRAPLLTIQGFASELESGGTEEERRHLLSRIGVNAHVAQERLNAVVEYLRLHVTTIVKARIDVNRLVDDLIAGQRSEDASGALDIRRDDLPEAFGDAEMIRAVLRRLIENAVKFSSREPTKEVRITGRVQSGSTVYSVRDTGAGFDPTKAGRLFALFRRLHRDNQFHGTGAGLALARVIVSRHQGSMWCESEGGKGAAFHFSLPVVKQVQIETKAPGNATIPRRTALSAIIVEDSEDDAHLLIAELRRNGIDVNARCVDTEAAYRSEIMRGADVVLADYTLPLFDAPRALAIRAELGSDVPFIVVTGSTSEETAVQCMKQGAADYILKDRLTRLSSAVAQAIAAGNESRQRRQAESSRNAVIRELDHRVKNNLAAVLELIELTGTAARTPLEYKAVLLGRVRALRIAHSELAAQHWLGASVRSLVLRAITSVDRSCAQRLDLEGDDIDIFPRAASGLTLTIHELATNALRHGAWSNPTGRVHVRIEHSAQRLALDWTEHGGPPVPTNPAPGVGMMLITDQLRYEVAGISDVMFNPAGVRVHIELPRQFEEEEEALSTISARPFSDAPLRNAQ